MLHKMKQKICMSHMIIYVMITPNIGNLISCITCYLAYLLEAINSKMPITFGKQILVSMRTADCCITGDSEEEMI